MNDSAGPRVKSDPATADSIKDRWRPQRVGKGQDLLSKAGVFHCRDNGFDERHVWMIFTG